MINSKVKDHNRREKFGPRKIKLNLEGFSWSCMESLQERIELKLSLSKVAEREERRKEEMYVSSAKS